MDSATVALASPASDDRRFWDRLRARVDTILEDRRGLPPAAAAGTTRVVESERGKRHREDSLMLVRGLDSVAATLSQLSDTLTAAQKGVSALATCSSQAREFERSPDVDEEEEEPKAKRLCGDSLEAAGLNGDPPVSGKEAAAGPDVEATAGAKLRQGTEGVQASAEVAQSTNLKRARNLAVSMATRAAALAKELKNIKSELHFMQERCGLLEEENKRLREGYDSGIAPEEDDLVRLQLEALLAEKSRLAQENANLTRENQSLTQLVEYHQLTSQDLDESYEDVMQGMRLDFSSPLGKISDNEEGEYDDGVPVTPVEVSSSPDE
ncbi:hypothetical protein HU200_017554 [Digitaria exilis]|uniref:Uncharacterized protein n=1 Tax=Digitaria exilis TaxID=1010633 RepID=A0A835F6I5_9POAL|nr:hypothetical protein HU200_017554 [Digitaria exilis]CAB3450940.1 unnamed protein product [Digitaria exilis]